MRTFSGGGIHKRRVFDLKFENVVSMENLLAAWEEFFAGKRKKPDVLKFKEDLLINIRLLHNDLVAHRYEHGSYYHFVVKDPKRRDIHKASVRDRLLHHAIHRKLYPLFDRIFVADSFSCRIGKGTHNAMNRFRVMHRNVSQNNTKTCRVLKLDIRKFFASIDHDILLSLLYNWIPDLELMWLFERIISSFSALDSQRGLPLGNLTSQLFANVYLHELDAFVKYQLRAKNYIRYADDFVLLSSSQEELKKYLDAIRTVLADQLRLTLHPKKIELRTISSGVDFLGWIHFPSHRILRTSTKNRMIRRHRTDLSEHVHFSYLGMVGHGNTHELQIALANEYWLFGEKDF